MNLTEYKKMMIRKCAPRRIPVSGTFELTDNCNLFCRMCYIHRNDKYSHDQLLSCDDWIRLGEICRDYGMVFLLLTGGEPLLRPDFKEIYTSLYHMGFMVSVNSNGLLWTNDMIRWISRMPPVQINITMYGSSAVTYERLCGRAAAYDVLISNLQKMKSAGLPVRLNTTISKLNVSDLAEIIAFAKNNGFSLNGTSYLFDLSYAGRGMDSIRKIRLTAEEAGIVRARLQEAMMPDDVKERVRNELKADLKKRPVSHLEHMSCSAGRSSVWVTSDGRLQPCGMLPVSEKLEHLEDFGKAWRSVCDHSQKITLPEECQDCHRRPWCVICGGSGMAENDGHLRHQAGDTAYLCRMTDAYLRELKEIL